MDNKKIKIDFDFKKITNDMNIFFSKTVPTYFSGLSTDMLVAWGVLGVGLILIVVGVFLL
jgi:hypothetical protein